MTKRAAPSRAIEWHPQPIPIAAGVVELGLLLPLPPLAELIGDLFPTYFHAQSGTPLQAIEQQVYAHLRPPPLMQPRHFLSPHLQANAARRGWHRDQDGHHQDMICGIVADAPTTPGIVFRTTTSQANRLYWMRRGTVHRSPESAAPRLLLRWDIAERVTARIFGPA